MTLIIPVWAVVVLCVLFGIRVLVKSINSFRVLSSIKSLFKLLREKDFLKLIMNK